jgi:lysophospholipase
VRRAAAGVTGAEIHWLQLGGGLHVRAAHWPRGDRGTVLLLGGRTDFIERFGEPVGELQSRGFAVWTFDWRGQGASTRLLADPIRNHVGTFADYLADLDLLLDRLVLPGLGGRRLIMMAHSMGGHLGAHMLARRPALFERAVLCSPMIDFARDTRLPRTAVAAMAQLVCLRPGMAARFGPGTSREPATNRPFAGNPLTTDPGRYAAAVSLMRARPELLTGGITWGWLRAALASVIALDRPRTLRRITMPVLVAIAGADRLVDNRATRRFVRLIAHGELVEFPGAQHELLNERDEHRLALWAAVDRFLAPC